VHVHTEN